MLTFRLPVLFGGIICCGFVLLELSEARALLIAVEVTMVVLPVATADV